MVFIIYNKLELTKIDLERMDSKLSRKMNQINSGKYIHFPTHLLNPRLRILLDLMSPHRVDNNQESVINNLNKNKFGEVHKHKKSTYLLLLVNDIIGLYVDNLRKKHGSDAECWLAEVAHFHNIFEEQRKNSFTLDSQDNIIEFVSEKVNSSIESSVNEVY
jgi:hypothetical protein